MATPAELARLVDLHLADLRDPEPNWTIGPSPMAGRGVFATRDIQQGELIFRERALVVGPTARKGSILNTCVCCHKLLAVKDFLCKNNCTLPVCDKCSDSEQHRNECELFRRWQPKDLHKGMDDADDCCPVNAMSLRILTAVRVFFLQPDQRALVQAMQANDDKCYRGEIIKAAQCFRKFPTTDKPYMDKLFRIVGVLNTNAFEAPCRVGDHEILLRGLFPLTAVMNHECTPNASHYFDNGRMAVVRAARFIPQGGEVTTTYTKILWSNLTRCIFLKMTKNFICDCKRCNDNTENGTYLSALFCREQGCKGIVIPVQTKTLQPDWRCLTCETVFPHSKMARYQDFALNTINNRINACSVSDMITFINEMCPRFCPPSNYVLVEAKLNVIWRMSRPTTEEFTEEQIKCKDRYRAELLELLEKLGAGDCTLKKLITEENL
ncbi:SET domain-containing protein SmydA-8-like isoform X1 [Musca vetustissima]|uniref:SET domain-containing protein SmydA-8-like isoform X1 n=2 Tax=Musca vetustissima TaxID=27455 RepID=UPI002AB7D76B|nr:SET domain-containing protein SmydA-8-like isoform X1 [Musca vetustissima]